MSPVILINLGLKLDNFNLNDLNNKLVENIGMLGGGEDILVDYPLSKDQY